MENKEKEVKIFADRYCENCGKMIFPTPMWVYKIKNKDSKTKYYCSYTCYKKGKWNEDY